MYNFASFLDKLAGRPSTIWRLAWLAFCLIVLLLAGARTLQHTAPYVLAGVAETPPGLPGASPTPATSPGPEPGWFASWILPLITWTAIGVGALVLVQLHRVR